ncbi:hypothetical protein M378DRAFT_27708 [Amanita muscaria Koide BX008]|uniref:Uncharacterized protein n=1 Tax=Amanita muscaria (strain Koide BX008) TaxID=946122 RepID=A0A0C2WPI0_AMAMK|nr:hypothetical protein M378DRAFT_27708 [Amanita muscaria Koide BX008]
MAPLFQPALIKSSKISRPAKAHASAETTTIKEDTGDVVVIYLEMNTKISISGYVTEDGDSHQEVYPDIFTGDSSESDESDENYILEGDKGTALINEVDEDETKDAVVWGPFKTKKRVEISSAWCDTAIPHLLVSQSIKKQSESDGNLVLHIHRNGILQTVVKVTRTKVEE